jgi:hypothetical protein
MRPVAFGASEPYLQRAIELATSGQRIEIVTEATFLELIEL